MTRTVYEIRDMLGETVAEHVRVDLPWGKKLVSWRVPGCDPRDGLMGLSTVDLPLYGSERIPSFTIGQTVLLCEGEKATEALWSAGIDALGTVTGAGTTPGEDALAPLLPFDVVSWEDYDDDGQAHMGRCAGQLRRLGGDMRRLIWAGARDKGDDAADFLARGGTSVAVELMLFDARRWPVEAAPAPRPIRPAYDRHDNDDRVESARSHLAQVVEEKLGPAKRRMGRSLFWPCPFHADRSPSFKVDLREPFFRCFGCGARGDVFTFLRSFEGIAFKDVLQDLAPAPANTSSLRTVTVWKLGTADAIGQ